jgi:hypothetical protein
MMPPDPRMDSFHSRGVAATDRIAATWTKLRLVSEESEVLWWTI